VGILSWIKAALRLSPGVGEGFPGVHRNPAAENAFGVDVWDCRAFTHNMVSTTGSAEIARRYVELRSSQGDEYRGQTPTNAHLITCNFTYPSSQRPSDGTLFKSKQMEDKWDIYLLDERLYFVRSWTGELTFTAQVRHELGALHLTALAAEEHQDPAFAPQVVDYLVKTHVLRHEVPHPLPPHLPPTARNIALFSFSSFGRRCSFGTYADTITMQTSPSP
jgi:hypothetical protein